MSGCIHDNRKNTPVFHYPSLPYKRMLRTQWHDTVNSSLKYESLDEPKSESVNGVPVRGYGRNVDYIFGERRRVGDSLS